MESNTNQPSGCCGGKGSASGGCCKTKEKLQKDELAFGGGCQNNSDDEYDVNTKNAVEVKTDQPVNKKKKQKREIDDLEEIKADGVEDLKEKFKNLKISKKLKAKLLKEEEERQKLRDFDPNIHCLKCKQATASLVIRGDKMCDACFNQSAIHRFKTNLRTNLKIWKDDLNLICVSGGQNSMTMLHLMYTSLFGKAQRKLFFKVHVIHIDESALYGWDEEKRQECINSIVNICKEYNFNYTIVPLESVFDIQLIDPNTKNFELIEEDKEFINQVFKSSEENRSKLVELIKYPSGLCSNKEDFVFYLKKWVLLDFSLKFNFKKLLLGCSGISITAKVLSEISKGRGITMPSNVSYVDDRYLEEIKFMNPMKDYLYNEIDEYIRINNVSHSGKNDPSLLDSKKGKTLPGAGSMNSLCQDFIVTLQESNTQTMHTILRTLGKLQISTGEESKTEFCVLCYGVVDHATNVLEVGSNIKSITPEGICTLMENGEKDTWDSDFEQHLCFGCKRIMENAVDKYKLIDALPTFILKNAGLA